MEPYSSVTAFIHDGNDLGFVLDERGQVIPDFTEHYTATPEFDGCHTPAFALDILQNSTVTHAAAAKGAVALHRCALQKAHSRCEGVHRTQNAVRSVRQSRKQMQRGSL